jgi:DNA-binding MarR family transcriptional regulator
LADFDLDTFLPYQLAVVSSRISRDFAQIYRERYGISIPEWRVIAHLSQSTSVSVREIHLKVDMDKSKVSRAAARLEQAGLVKKSVNAADRRLVSLELTAAGQALLEEIAPVARAFERRVLERLGADGAAFRATLAALMDETGDLTSR